MQTQRYTWPQTKQEFFSALMVATAKYVAYELNKAEVENMFDLCADHNSQKNRELYTSLDSLSRHELNIQEYANTVGAVFGFSSVDVSYFKYASAGEHRFTSFLEYYPKYFLWRNKHAASGQTAVDFKQ